MSEARELGIDTRPAADLTLTVGRVYRAKRPQPTGSLFSPIINDRQIRWIGLYEVQYDSPSIRIGGKYRKVTREAFLKWAARDVTDELPENGDWAEWNRNDTAKNK